METTHISRIVCLVALAFSGLTFLLTQHEHLDAYIAGGGGLLAVALISFFVGRAWDKDDGTRANIKPTTSEQPDLKVETG